MNVVQVSDFDINPEEKRLYEKYIGALNDFLREQSIAGVLLVGSLAREAITEDSDIDIVLIDEKFDKKKEIRTYRSGIEIHQIQTSCEALKEEIKEERESNYRLLSESVAEGRVLRGGDDVAELITTAQETVEADIPVPSQSEIQSTITFLQGQKSETRRMLANSRMNFQLRVNHVIQNCLRYYFIAEQKRWPPWKEMEERIEEAEFKRLIHKCLDADDDEQKHELICELIDDVVRRLEELR